MRNLFKNYTSTLKYLPAILWSAFIFFLCFLPGNDLPKNDFFEKIYLDKIVHLVLYFVLLQLMIKTKSISNKRIIIASLLCIAQGIFIEIMQESTLIQGRSFDVYDIVANIVGVVLSVIVIKT